MWEGKLWSRGQEQRYKELLVRGLGYDGVLLESLDFLLLLFFFFGNVVVVVVTSHIRLFFP